MDASQLKKYPLFEGVSDDKLGKIAPFTQLVEFAEGKVIIREGGFSNDFFMIDEGEVEVRKGDEIVATLGEGDVVGEQGLLEKEDRNASVVAKSVVRALKIEHWELARMRKAMPEVVEQLRKTVEERSSD